MQYSFQNEKYLIYSVVAVCLCFMQSYTAREIKPLPQTNRAYERLRKLLMLTTQDAVPIMRNVSHTKPEYLLKALHYKCTVCFVYF
jgi:hypothetical protein